MNMSNIVKIEKNRSLTSFIADHEELSTIQRIEQELGFSRPRPPRWWMAVKLYTREGEQKLKNSLGQDTLLLAPDTVGNNDKYRAVTGQVIAQGPLCYKSEEYKECGPSCKVGDYVAFPRHAGYQGVYRGISVQYIPEDAIFDVLEDPSHFTRDY